MSSTTVLILVFFVLVGILLPGWIGSRIAARYGRNPRLGFVLGAIGSVGGWIVAAVVPWGAPSDRARMSAGRWLLLVVGLALAVQSATFLTMGMLSVAAPQRFGPVFLERFG